MSGAASFAEHAAGAEDLPEVMALSAREAAGPDWAPATWQSFCRQEEGNLRQAGLWLAREREGSLVGFLAWSAVAGVAELQVLLVATPWRRQGIATVLLRSWVRRMEAAGVQEAQLEVRSGNTAARRLYEAAGFSVVGVRPDYYQAPREDAVLMTLQLPVAFETAGAG